MNLTKILNSKYAKTCNVFNKIAKYRAYAMECNQCINKIDYANSITGITALKKKQRKDYKTQYRKLLQNETSKKIQLCAWYMHLDIKSSLAGLFIFFICAFLKNIKLIVVIYSLALSSLKIGIFINTT